MSFHRKKDYKANQDNLGVIKIFKDLEELKKEVKEINKEINLDHILGLDFPFLESENGFTLMNLPLYREEQKNSVFVSGDKVLVYSSIDIERFESKFKKMFKRKHGESTVVIYHILKNIFKNYSQQFEKIRDLMNELDLDPILDSVEGAGRTLRRLTDRLEGLLHVIIELKRKEIEAFNVDIVAFDYEMLNTETRYLLERSRSHIYRIASLRTKSEMKSNKELNDTMKRLTVITTFLAIASIVVNVPGTVGAIFGIPALSDTYFTKHTEGLVLVLILTTLLSLVLGYFYWKSLHLKSP